MALILDTHVLLWLDAEPEKIPSELVIRIEAEPIILISAASVWEIAIKLKTGKLTLQLPLPQFLDKYLTKWGVQLIPIELPHIYRTQLLPLHHRDPFDRLLIAQSFVENIPIVSADAIFDQYILSRIWS